MTGRPPDEGEPRSVTVRLRVLPEERDTWREAAQREVLRRGSEAEVRAILVDGKPVSVSDWLRGLANRRASIVLRPKRKR
jgi:hypothetical protein